MQTAKKQTIGRGDINSIIKRRKKCKFQMRFIGLVCITIQ